MKLSNISVFMFSVLTVFLLESCTSMTPLEKRMRQQQKKQKRKGDTTCPLKDC